MRILADSNVFIDFWKKPTKAMLDIFRKEDIVICGVVRSELLHGARSKSDYKNIDEALDDFDQLEFKETDWNILGKQLYELRINGITVPYQDAIIALIAVKHNIPIWTNDKHFSYMKKVMKDIQLYNSESTEI